MREASRRQILADMGITVWRLRGDTVQALPAVEAAAPEPAPPASRELPAPRRVSGSVEARQSAPAPAIGASRGATDSATVAQGSPAPAPVSAAAQPEPVWSVLSLAVERTVMLVDGDCSRRDLRLAQDVLCAAADAWRQRPVRRRFGWPPPVNAEASPTPDAARRALAAFAAKDLEDHGAVLLLCESAVAARMGDLHSRCRRVEMPALHDLGRDSAAKRRLWQAIRDARQ